MTARGGQRGSRQRGEAPPGRDPIGPHGGRPAVQRRDSLQDRGSTLKVGELGWAVGAGFGDEHQGQESQRSLWNPGMPPLCPARRLFQLTPDRRAVSHCPVWERGPKGHLLPEPAEHPRGQAPGSARGHLLEGSSGFWTFPWSRCDQAPAEAITAGRGPTVHRGPCVALRREHGLRSHRASSHVTCGCFCLCPEPAPCPWRVSPLAWMWEHSFGPR